METVKSNIRTLDAATVCAVKELIRREGSLRKAANVLGVSHGVVAHVVNERGNHVSHATENRLRLTLSLPPLPQPILIPPCKDCGGAHYGDCNGKPVAIRPVSQRNYRTIHAMPTGLLAWKLTNRAPMLDAPT